MDERLFMSSSNYFDRLRKKAREIDNTTDKLTETWKTPHLLIGGYADCTAETDAYLKSTWDSIRSTKDAVETCRSELKISLTTTDELLKESRTIYEELKEQCDNLETVMAEYGYHYEKDNDIQETEQRDNQKDAAVKNIEEISGIQED